MFSIASAENLLLDDLVAYDACFRGRHCTATSDTFVQRMLLVQQLIPMLNLWLSLNLMKHLLKQGYVFDYHMHQSNLC